MSAINDQMTSLWHTYITHQFTTSPHSIKEELKVFLMNLTVDFLDYEEFEYGEYGEIAIRYLDFLNGEEEVEIRRIDSVSDSFEPTWGFMHEKKKNHFDSWVKNRFNLDDEETRLILLWVDTFLRAILKNKNQ